MSTSHFFNNKLIKLPGAYSRIKAESPALFSNADYSKVLILNTNPDYAFGAGVTGQVTTGGDAFYKFKTLPEARAFLKSGYLWYVVQQLYQPSRLQGRLGISELQVMNALTTTAPLLTMALTSGSLVLYVKDESANANGVKKNLSATDDRPEVNLKQGYALSLEAGVKDSSKYIIKLWQGTYKGEWTDGLPYDGIDVKDSIPELIVESPEISSVDEFVAWANADELFNMGFAIKASTSGNFVAGDITANKFILATGGAAVYNPSNLTKAFDLLKNGDFSIVLSLNKVGDTNADTINASLQHFVQSETRFHKYLAVAGSGTFSTDITAAQAFNSEYVWCINGTPRKSSSLSPLGYREFDSLSMAASIVGRIAGLPPQVPPTFKDIDIDGVKTPLTTGQLEEALDAGLMTVNWDDDLRVFCITRGINTLQNNSNLQNPDGSTFSIQISRICTQLNVEVVINAKKQIFSSNETANLFTVSASYLKNWIKSYLSTKIATPQQDNLILGIKDVSVTKEGDALYANYEFYPNSEVAFLFFTGIAIY